MFKEPISTTTEWLRNSARPLFVWGAGMRPYAESALALARSLGVPVACTWGSIDLIHHDDSLAVGGFGTHGTRAANLAVQNSDLLISIGSRLDTKATGVLSEFAKFAKLVICDIDGAEIAKFSRLNRRIDLGICMDAGEFIEALQNTLHGTIIPLFDEWRAQITEWKARYRPEGPAYDLMRSIGEHTTKDDIIVSDTGNTLGWIMQGFPFKGERMVHAWNMTPMGYGLGAAVGAAFAAPGRRVVAIVGDGGALMSINELATIKRNNLNIKSILLNNKSHSMCCFTQDQWLGGKHYATTIEGGLGFPKDWRVTAEGFGISNIYAFDEWIADSGPQFMEVTVDPKEHLAFQVKYGEPIA